MKIFTSSIFIKRRSEGSGFLPLQLYIPSRNNPRQIAFPTNCKNNSAIIGEKSRPPIGGIIFLNGVKNMSHTFAKKLKNGLFQSMDGIQVRKILTMSTKKYN